MTRPLLCAVCGDGFWRDGTRRELEIGTRCGKHSGKWMCIMCFKKWTEQRKELGEVRE